jgi:hypothetical protein
MAIKKARSVATITANLGGMVTELEAHADDQAVKADAAEAAARVHLAESTSARRIADNLRALLSD